MPRAALEPGTCSEEISAFPYTRTAGQGLRRAVDRKHATLYVARGVYRRPDGSYLQVKREGKSSAEAVRKVKEVLNDLSTRPRSPATESGPFDRPCGSSTLGRCGSTTRSVGAGSADGR